jgi:hypothetical protein
MGNLSIPGAVGIWTPASGYVQPTSRNLNGSADYFTRASESLFQIADSPAWISVWVYPDSFGANNRPVVSRYDSTGVQEWMIYYRTASSAFSFIARNAADTASVVAVSAVSPSVSTWYHVFAYHDPDANEVGISVNGETFVTVALSGGLNTGSVPTQIGSYLSTGPTRLYWDGLISNVGFGKPPSTPTWADLRDALYNNGQGLEWDEITSAQRTEWGLTAGRGVFFPMTSSTLDEVDAVQGLTATEVGGSGAGGSYRNKALDWSGNGNHGTQSGRASLAALFDSELPDALIGGVTEWSAVFDGTNDYVDFGNVVDFDGTTARSWAFWFKHTASDSKVFASKRLSSGNLTGWQINQRATSNKLLLLLDNISSTNSLRVETDSTYNDGVWHHACVTYDGSQSASGVTWYVDGSSVAQTTVLDTLSASTASSASRVLGTYGSNYYDGKLADFREYSDELTAGEVATLASGGDHTDNLVFHVDFREGPGGQFFQSSDECKYVPDSGSSSTDLIQETQSKRPVGSTVFSRDLVFSFDGTGDVLAGTTKLDITGYSAITVSQWIRCDDTSPKRSFSLLHSGSDDIRIRPGTGTGGSAQAGIDDGTAYAVDITPCTVDTWFHIALTFNGSTLVVYKDGAVVGSTAASFNFATADGTLQIGGNGTEFFDGRVGVTAIWDYALTQSQIQQIMDETDPTKAYLPRGILVDPNIRQQWHSMI